MQIESGSTSRAPRRLKNRIGKPFAITEQVPVVGTFLKQMLLAGDGYNEHTLSRFYVLHAAVMPVLDHSPRHVNLADVRSACGEW